jgi:hypothetical protein
MALATGGFIIILAITRFVLIKKVDLIETAGFVHRFS